jgi:cyclic pyranopterin phosphate synthase
MGSLDMAKIVDIGGKQDVPRRATAEGELLLSAKTLAAVRDGRIEKGDPLAAAEIAALQGVKHVWEVLPHCHPIPLTAADARVTLGDEGVRAAVTVEASYKTGVEMEALYGVTVALLTVWDMTKAWEKDEGGQYPFARLVDVRVVRKEKGHGR